MAFKFKIAVFALLLVFSSCGTKNSIDKQGSEHLRFLGEMEIPNAWDFDNTVIGGLSGIDYNPKTNTFFVISDDRSVRNPARFYELKLEFDEETNQPINFEFLNVKTLKNKEGKNFTNAKEDPENSIDPEDIRYNSNTDTFIISNEGERLPQYNIYQNPSIYKLDKSGKVIAEFIMPAILSSNQEEKGIRRNESFEGLTYANDFSAVFVALEEPLYEDGNRSTTINTSTTRIFKFDTKSLNNTTQYAYELDPVKYPPTPTDAFSVNGITGILDVGEDTLYVMERSYSDGRAPCSIRIYKASYANATNVKDFNSLVNATYIPMKKELLLDLDNLGRYTDNFEGITIGSTLKNGNKTLLLISDDNFAEKQKTQLFIFEILK